MPSQSSHQTHLNKTRDLIALTERLTQEYAELKELSRVLRTESRQLCEDSRVLRRMSAEVIRRQETYCVLEPVDQA